jgi:hypothetical protein
MGVKQSDCTGCGAPVGFIDRRYCCRCTARQKEVAARAACPRCGQQRVLQADTGRCITCSRVCTACGHPLRSKSSALCRTCLRKSERDAAKDPCSRCSRPDICARTPAGAGTARVPGRPYSRPVPVSNAAECGSTQGLDCARPAGSVTPIAPSSGPNTSLPNSTIPRLAAGLHDRSRREILRRPGLHDDHFPRAASSGRPAQPPPVRTRTLPPPGSFDGLPRPCPGNLPHQSRFGHGHRPGRAARGRPPTTPGPRGPRPPATFGGSLLRLHDPLA